MESRFRSIFLILAMSAAILPRMLYAAEEVVDDADDQSILIEPQIERSEFDESLIDSEDFQVSAFAGLLSIEDFGTNAVTGFNLTYHVDEDYFVQAIYGTSKAGKTSFEVLSGGAPLISDEERELEYYLVNIGYNLLPGEAFVTDQTTINTALYITGGAGSTEFAGGDHSTLSFGFGYRVLFADAFSISADVRDIVFNLDILGEDKTTHNLEFSLALGWYF